MNNPTVSVIIPTYNRANLVSRAIKSVLNQTFRDFKIIVVDDGSTDNTEEVIRGFNDPRIEYIKHEINRGGNAARNTGLRNPNGEYIAFLDSDDEWLPTKLEKQIDKFEKSSDKVALIYGWAEIIDKKGCLYKKLQPTKKGNILPDILKGNFLPSSTVIVRRAYFNKVGLFDENFTSCQDREMWTRIAAQYQVEVIPECLAKMYRHSGFSIGASSKKITYGYYQYFTKFQKEYLKYGMEKELSENLSWVGYKLAKEGYQEESKKCFRLSFEYDKTNLKNYIRFLRSLIIRKVRISKWMS